MAVWPPEGAKTSLKSKHIRRHENQARQRHGNYLTSTGSHGLRIIGCGRRCRLITGKDRNVHRRGHIAPSAVTITRRPNTSINVHGVSPLREFTRFI